MARVIGNIWATHKEQSLTGLRFVVAEPVHRKNGSSEEMIVAADPLGAGVGQEVLLAQGSSAARALRNKEMPVDAAVIAIIEKVEIDKG